MENTAERFKTTVNYAAGDLCLYNGRLYIFTSSHSAGAWDEDDVKAYDRNIENDITRIISGYENAVNAAGFVNTVVYEMSQMTGTRYKLVATNAPDPRN